MVIDKLKSLLNMFKYDTTPTLERLSETLDFAQKQAAFVSQVTLYTYIKTRSGTQYPKLFENEKFLTSLKISRWHIFAACVADLSLFIAAQAHKKGLSSTQDAAELANHISAHILRSISQDDVPMEVFDELISASQKRSAACDFTQAAIGSYAFQTSADALLKWVPVIDEFKLLDEEIVRNSIHLRWIAVRRDIIGGMNINTVHADWRAIHKL